MYPLRELDIGIPTRQILASRGIYFAEQIKSYTRKELLSFGLPTSTIEELTDKLQSRGFEPPPIKKVAKTRKAKGLTLAQCLEMPEGVELFDSGYRGECAKEDTEQEACFNGWKLKNVGCEMLFVHINNETMSNVQGYMKMIRKGMLPRAPDNLIVMPSGKYSGFACELKRRDISKSLNNQDRKKHFQEQKAILEAWAKMGFYTCVAAGADQFFVAWDKYISKNNID